MDLDELQSVQSRERQTDSLQQLRESFYTEASEYVQDLRDARDDAAQRAEDPWDNPEVSQLSDEIKTAEQTVEAIYDRRIGKIVKKASLAAADMPTDDEGFTAEERALFESLVADIQNNREHVLDMIAGDIAPGTSPVEHSDPSPTASQSADANTPESPTDRQPSPPPEPEPESGVSAADVMGSDSEPSSEEPTPPPEPTEQHETAEQTPPPEPDRPPAESDSSTESESATAGEAVDRKTVRITKDVGEILGVDQREYDLSTDDVVTLPAANVGPLLERDAAEQFD